jgi:hypothetical protein
MPMPVALMGNAVDEMRGSFTIIAQLLALKRRVV